MPLGPIYSKTLIIPPSVIDENGHANNVAYVQWMQEIAIEHYTSLGGLEAQRPFGTWLVREHKVEYFLPALAGEEVEVRTWVENIRGVRSLRKYEFIRRQDGKTLVKGETDWAFVDPKSGKPSAIPKEIRALFQKN
jgi:acyl-CoA thioester hydrolase